jgi:hypothetical protein
MGLPRGVVIQGNARLLLRFKPIQYETNTTIEYTTIKRPHTIQIHNTCSPAPPNPLNSHSLFCVVCSGNSAANYLPLRVIAVRRMIHRFPLRLGRSWPYPGGAGSIERGGGMAGRRFGPSGRMSREKGRLRGDQEMARRGQDKESANGHPTLNDLLTIPLRPPQSLQIIHLPSRLAIHLVPHKHHHQMRARHLPAIREPPVQAEKRRALGDIVDEDGGGGAAVVGPGDGAESFLACGVP